jgi:hypothetical protein
MITSMSLTALAAVSCAGIVDAGLEEDVERGAEALLLVLQLGHTLGLGGAERQGLKLREDVADVVELLHEATQVLPHIVCLLRAIEIGAHHGEAQRHLGELALLHLGELDLVVDLVHHAAQACHRERRAHEHDGEEGPDAEPARRGERDVHRAVLAPRLRSSRSNASPVR